MALRSSLFSFKLVQNRDETILQVEQALKSFFSKSTFAQIAKTALDQAGNDLLIVYGISDSAITFTLRYYASDKLISLHGEITSSSIWLLKFSNSEQECLRKQLETVVGTPVERIPVLKRDNEVPLYFLSSDNRVLEYDFDKVIVHEKSEYQDIKILHSPTLGNALLLDDLQNLAEADINYTNGLMNYPQDKDAYQNKEILILGGGDGGLLHELLKLKPKFVTMVDIDERVMKHCQVHLKGACGDSLDSFTGENYHVIVGDCVVYMKQSIENGKSFDFIFNDLTDIPINKNDNKDLSLAENSADMWIQVKHILELSFRLLRSDGKYLNHAIGIGCQSALNQYEQLLTSEISIKVNFSKHTALVPSFLEEWAFYKIWKA